ncbi:MAG: cytochrome c oxidase assembly protein [Actinomycetota bacterium]
MEPLMLAATAPATAERAGFPAWHFHADVWVLVALLVGAYVLALRAYSARTGRPAATRRQKTAFAGAVLTIFIASDWPVHDVAEGYLYSAHMVQHMLMTLIAAPLFLLGTPEWMARRILSPPWLLRTVKTVAKPVPNLIQANTILVLSHWPLIVEGTVEFHPLHFVAHAVLLTSALLMWMPVVSPLPEVPRLPPLMQMLYLFLQTIVPTVPASFLTFGEGLLYKVYGEFPRLWGISAITDQQVAGLVMKIGAGLYLWAVIIVIFFRWYEREERQARNVLVWEDVERELDELERPGAGNR